MSKSRKSSRQTKRNKQAQGRAAALNASWRIERALESRQTLDASLMSEILQLPWEFTKPLISRILTREDLSPFLLPSAFPLTIARLGAILPTQYPHSLSMELHLALAILAHSQSKIQQFIDKSLDFERHLLLGRLSQAERLRSEIISSHGVSLWTIETGFLLGELITGVQGNREALTSVQEQLNNRYLTFLISFLTQRIESAVSTSSYHGAMRSALADVSDDERFAPAVAETIFRLDFPQFHHHGHLKSILGFAREYSSVDVYNTLLRVLTVLTCQQAGSDIHDTLSSTLQKAVGLFTSPRLHVLNTIVTDTAPINADDLTRAISEIVHAYTVSNYEQAIEIGHSALKLYPECFELYEVTAKAAAYLCHTPPQLLPSNSLAQAIFENVFHLVARDRDAVNAASALLKAGYSLDVLSMGHRLVGFWLGQARINHPSGTSNIRLATSTRLTSWHAVKVEPALRHRLLRRCEQLFPNNAGVLLHNKGPDACPPLPLDRVLRFSASTLEQQGEFARATELYRQLQRIAGDRFHLLQPAIAGLIRCLMALNRHADAAEAIVDAHVKNPVLLWGEIIQTVEQVTSALYSPESRHSLRTYSWPLLLHIAFDHHVRERDNYHLYVAYYDAMLARRATRPSILFVDAPDRHFISFLQWVCIPDVLRRSPRFVSGADMESERMKILQYLLKHDTRSRSTYASEIATLTKKVRLREAVTHIEASRIFVNTDGIYRSLGDLHEQTFHRFVSILSLNNPRLRRQLVVIGFESYKLLIFDDLGFSLFKDLFLTVRDSFVSSKADGLDTYLSIRIRHGTLGGKLRGQFERLHLLTRRVTAQGEYARNEHWFIRLLDLDPYTIAEVDLCLRVLSARIDSIIDDVNLNWIRVRNEQHPSGMFEYDFSKLELLQLLGQMNDPSDSGVPADYGRFVAECFKILWQRTSLLLTRVRARIASELRDRLTLALTSAEEDVKAAWPTYAQSELGVNFANARTMIQRETQTVSQWFTVPANRSVPPFGFRVLLEAATEMVRNIHQGADFEPFLTCDVDRQLAGEWVTHVVDLFFLFCDNIVAHANTIQFRPALRVSFEGDRLTLTLENTIGPKTDLVALEEVVRQLNLMTESKPEELRIQSEGRSGYPKVHHIIKNILRRDKYFLKISILPSRVFHVHLEFDAHGLLVGEVS